MKPLFASISLAGLMATSALAMPKVDYSPATPAGIKPAASRTEGRGNVSADKQWLYQWPGAYFETRIRGTEGYFQLGKGDVILRVNIDGQPLPALVKPEAGYYHISGLSKKWHDIRVEVASENQAAPGQFGGFFVKSGVQAEAPKVLSRSIEFIGDSHTVGYGNISDKRDCTTDEVWATTDNTQAFGPITAKHYKAAYRINAISGRGIVRNYNGFAADHLPEAYPYLLFDHSLPDTNMSWQPQIVVIALGTNDFSTPLNAGEQWVTRDELHADYERTYVHFVQSLRQKYPGAYFILWATDLWDGEIASEVSKVAAQLHQAGETKISTVTISGLQMSGCHAHPSLADETQISQSLVRVIDNLPDVWAGH